MPGHICDPLEEPSAHDGHAAPAAADAHAGHWATERAAEAHTGHGGHAGMSMADMARDMRRRFLVALVFSIPIFLYSPIAVDVFGLELAAPFGMRTDVFSLLLSGIHDVTLGRADARDTGRYLAAFVRGALAHGGGGAP